MLRRAARQAKLNDIALRLVGVVVLRRVLVLAIGTTWAKYRCRFFRCVSTLFRAVTLTKLDRGNRRSAGMDLPISAIIHQTLAGRNVLRGVKAKAAEITESSGSPAFVLCLYGVRAVVDDEQIVSLGDSRNGVHITRTTREVHRQYRAGSRCDSLFDLDRIDFHRHRVNIR